MDKELETEKRQDRVEAMQAYNEALNDPKDYGEGAESESEL